MSKFTKVVIVVAICVVVISGIFFSYTQAGVRIFNEWRFGLQEVHDQTDYATLRRVEDTARAMVATWEGDYLQWQQFKDSDIQEERNWANGALMRANRTSTTFNNFMLENSFVWAYGVPDDIAEPLPTLP